MVSSLLLRVSMVLLLIGLMLGIYMGISAEHILVPAHTHLNLVGGVLMFMVGLYYHAFPQAGEGALAKMQAWLHIIGAIVFPAGLALNLLYGPPYTILIPIGALTFLLAMILFAWIVFRTSNAPR